MAGILNSAIFNSAHLGFSHLNYCTQTLTQTISRLVATIFRKKTHSWFSVNLMMGAILNSTMLNSDTAILDSAILHPNSDSNSFILPQLDDGSHLEFCHVEFRNMHLGFRHFVIFSQIHSKHSHSTLNLNKTNSNWLKLIPSHYNLIMAGILNSAIFNTAILDSAILHKTLTQTNSIWLKVIHSQSTWWWHPSWILAFLAFNHFAQKNFTHSFWLNLMMVAILKFCHVGFRHCHQAFRHLVIISQIHSKTLSLQSDSDST